MEKPISIPILYAVDDEYAYPLSVSLTSLFENADISTIYEVYILVSGQLVRRNQELFRSLSEKYSEHTITFREVNFSYFMNDITVQTTELTVVCYYRLLAALILSQIDKCIYFDCDVMINNDLKDMYMLDIEEYYIAGCIDWQVQVVRESINLNNNELGLPDLGQYINSGVLIMNLKKIRDNKLTEKFILHAKKAYLRNDQDVLNVCCYGKIKILPIYYNFFVQYDKLVYCLFSENDSFNKKLMDAKGRRDIIHFAGAQEKPWNNSRVRYGLLWWEYAYKTFNRTEYDLLKYNLEKQFIFYNWKHIIKKCRRFNNIVIIGFSAIGCDILSALKKILKDKNFCLVDNDEKKQGRIYNGVTVKNVNDIKDQEDFLIINTSQRFYQEINVQLYGLNINEERIIRYINKGLHYYLSLDAEFYEDEFEQILLREYGTDKIYDNMEFSTVLNRLSLSPTEEEKRLKQKYFLDFWLLSEVLN